jgi:two-component system, OmpR family, sensor kinase
VTSSLSLRSRLLLAVGAVTLLALSFTGALVYTSLRSYLYNQVDNTLATSSRAVEITAEDPEQVTRGGAFFVPSGRGPSGDGPGGAGGPLGAPHGAGASPFCAVGRETAPGMFIEVRSSKDQVVSGAAGQEECPAFQPGSASSSPELPAVITGFARSGSGPGGPTTYFTVTSTAAGGPAFRVQASELRNGDVLVVATPVSSVINTLSRLLLAELLVAAGALLAAVLLGLWLVQVGLRPLQDVERTAEAIAGGDLMNRVPNSSARTEVGHLARAFNVMAERVEELVTDLRSSEARLRRFVGDASHELRTPIAAVSAYAQLFREGAASRPEDLQRVMDGIERESARMANLVEDLLTLARLDERHGLGADPVELVGLVMEASETAMLVGPRWPLDFVADDAVEVAGDRSALRRVVDNLLSNVRAHTPPGTRTTVTVGRARAGADAFIEVADNGPGISEEQAGHIFERFFRLDPSRSRQSGGAGLGLAIVVSIVDLHGGRVSAGPRAGGGAVFRVTLPALGHSPGADEHVAGST